MCLKKVDKTFTVKDDEYHKEETWYKVVIKDSDIENDAEDMETYYSPYMFSNIKLNCTYEQKEEYTCVSHGARTSSYKLGYHFYSLSAARKFQATNSYFRILKCKVSHIVAKGEDRHGEACVALRFTIVQPSSCKEKN